MDRLQRQFIKPESTLIEKTALELAAAFYEVGRGQGLKSKYKNPRDYAKAHVKNFIPKAVDILMDMLGKDHISSIMKDAIYDAFMERTNDTDLSGALPQWENPLAATFILDTKDNRGGPLIGNSPKKKHKGRIEDLPLDKMLFQGNKQNG